MSRLDRVATVSARIGWKALTAAEYQVDGYAFLATPNIKNRNIDFTNVNYISEFRYRESPELQLTEGDVLLTKDGFTLGTVNIVRHVPRPATVNGSIAVLRSFGIHSGFLHYVIASSITQERIWAVKDGMDVLHLFQRDIKKLPVPLPPPEEQRRIANFLDSETARIDRLLSLQSRQLSLLSAHHRSRLSETSDKLMRECGKIRLRHLLTRIEQGWSPQCEDRPAEGGDWGVIKAGCVNSGEFDTLQQKALPQGIEPRLEYALKPGDLLMSRASGSPELIGSTGIVPDIQANLLLCDKVYRLTVDQTRATTAFIAHMLRSHTVRERIRNGISGADGMANNLPIPVVKDCVVPNAPFGKQGNIVTDLIRDRDATARARSALERSTSLIVERRQALITAAVTGQIDVSTASGRGIGE
ncbi:restriction endonuclease subunit S [Streptomyces adonidis]|uniref:restriction endonuclease subunit S n=1 Tax=Streptomyces adonidis TaxID=3231367 RepID=UPI0034DB75F4